MESGSASPAAFPEEVKCENFGFDSALGDDKILNCREYEVTIDCSTPVDEVFSPELDAKSHDSDAQGDSEAVDTPRKLEPELETSTPGPKSGVPDPKPEAAAELSPEANPTLNPRSGRRRTSKYCGVCSANRRNQWQARILMHGKVTHLGYFDTEEEAARIYDIVSLSLHGDKANTNFPRSDYTEGKYAERASKLNGLSREDLQKSLGVKPIHKTSRYNGVSKKRGKWVAKVMIDKKLVYHASFEDEKEAALAYDSAVRRLKPSKAHAYVNFSESTSSAAEKPSQAANPSDPMQCNRGMMVSPGMAGMGQPVPGMSLPHDMCVPWSQNMYGRMPFHPMQGCGADPGMMIPPHPGMMPRHSSMGSLFDVGHDFPDVNGAIVQPPPTAPHSMGHMQNPRPGKVGDGIDPWCQEPCLDPSQWLAWCGAHPGGAYGVASAGYGAGGLPMMPGSDDMRPVMPQMGQGAPSHPMMWDPAMGMVKMSHGMPMDGMPRREPLRNHVQHLIHTPFGMDGMMSGGDKQASSGSNWSTQFSGNLGDADASSTLPARIFPPGVQPGWA
uniref:Ap2-like protein n=1 Tax=Tetraselmis sp. GSL018 TaxID=582737 RepID=A0A061QWI6_9CHLO|eukprot:CAMPEP_0177599260 /NCGR_PEP_ID=MMETSP0419_2-20121207/12880_1 /TAXON_ID=582737 /ORGANISM="Tetraselmis sp., Strain GSL018" /LENGTH=555 /DNA_ID=CAMNT_0019091945 /DNA_START=563 /DNA_END=2230 /DNA_ORIENTATION=-